jgi:hypothetical protein
MNAKIKDKYKPLEKEFKRGTIVMKDEYSPRDLKFKESKAMY